MTSQHQQQSPQKSEHELEIGDKFAAEYGYKPRIYTVVGVNRKYDHSIYLCDYFCDIFKATRQQLISSKRSDYDMDKFIYLGSINKPDPQPKVEEPVKERSGRKITLTENTEESVPKPWYKRIFS